MPFLVGTLGESHDRQRVVGMINVLGPVHLWGSN
jgi:hypothetical protein